MRRIWLWATMAAVFAISTTAMAAEKADPSVKDADRTFLLSEKDKTPTDFQLRNGPQSIINKIKEFRDTLPKGKGYKARIYIGKFFNQNYAKFDDRVLACEPLDPKGRIDGEAWYFAGGPGEGDGQRSRSTVFKHGKKHGEQKFYARDRKERRYYVNKTVPWVDGKVHGVVKMFYPDGKLMSESTYDKGELTGVSRSYDRDGKILRQISYKDGVKHGRMVEYWRRTRKLKKDIPYKEGKVHGTAKLYYDHGQLKMEGQLWEDNYHGVQKYYHEDGALRKVVYWLLDEEVSKEEFDRDYKVPPKPRPKKEPATQPAEKAEGQGDGKKD